MNTEAHEFWAQNHNHSAVIKERKVHGSGRAERVRISHRTKAVNAVKRSQYSTAIRHIVQTKVGKKSLQEFLKIQCRREATKYGKGEKELSKTLTQQSVKEFSWRAILDDLKKHMPWVFRCVCAVLTKKSNENEMLKLNGDTYGPGVPVLGMAMGMLLYRRNPRKFNFLQEICSLEIWGSGSHQKVDCSVPTSDAIKTCTPIAVPSSDVAVGFLSVYGLYQSFQRLGVCKGKQGTFSSVDRLTRAFDKEIVEWREKVEDTLNKSDDFISDTESLNNDLNISMNDHSYALPNIEQNFLPPMDLSPPIFSDHSPDAHDVDVIEHLSSFPTDDDFDNGFPDNGPIPMIKYDTANELQLPYKTEYILTNGATLQDQRMSADDESIKWLDAVLENYAHVFESPKPSDSGETVMAVEHPGYCLVWDNVQLLSTARRQSERRNKMHLWAMCYAAKNRVNFRHLVDQRPPAVQEMQLSLFLPTHVDYDNLRTRMEVIVMRLLTEHLKAFRHVNVVEHIPHQYSEESSVKSRIVNLGVIEENPASTQGVINILDCLHTYVPRDRNGNIHVIPVHGDGLSIERMRGAKAARSGSETAEARLEGIEPVPQEFHKRVILMQDTYNELYCSRSGADRGTLYQIRNAFGHNNVSGNVMKTFNHNADLLRFATEGLTTLIAMQYCDLQDQEGTPKNFPDNIDDQETYLLNVAQEIVKTVWQQVSARDVRAVLDACDDVDVDDDDFYEYCFCKEDKDEPMIQCSNWECPNGTWFHGDCVGVDIDRIQKVDWWCGDSCKSTGRSQYCTCHRYIENLQTIRCHSGSKCSGFEFYHKVCLDLPRKPGKRWVCEMCTTDKKNHSPETEDHVFLYSCALLYQGLKDMAYKDAVRENDGEAMISHWRIDMSQFWQKKHNKYLIIGHKLLSDVLGAQINTRLSNEIKWNRTANLRGGPGHNLELDLVNEFLNRDFKENLKRCHGKYTGKHVNRTSKFIGTLQKDLDKAFQRRVSGLWIPQHNGSSGDYQADVVKFTNEYRDDNLFKHTPGRQHSAFPGFVSIQSINNPEKLKGRLKKYAKKLDMYRELLP